MVNSIDFSKRIELILTHYDLSASAFAEKIGVGRSSISHILSGRNKPSLDFIMKILEVFPELNLYWLMNGTGSFLKNSPTPSSNPVSAPAPVSPKVQKNIAPVPENFSSDPSFAPDRKIAKVIIFYTDGSFEAFEKYE